MFFERLQEDIPEEEQEIEETPETEEVVEEDNVEEGEIGSPDDWWEDEGEVEEL